jgi:hypothetical protein
MCGYGIARFIKKKKLIGRDRENIPRKTGFIFHSLQ